MIPSIYNYSDYLAYIDDRVKADPHSWGVWSRLSKAASCQPTYLSQAMRRKVHLSSEQVFGIARFWALSETETDFFLLLHEYSRAANPVFKTRLLEKIQRMKRDHENISKRLEKERLEPGEKEMLFYSSWHWQALHIIVSIPEFQTTEAISERLNLPEPFIQDSLEKLEKFNLVARDGEKWIYGSGDLHLPKESLMLGIYHSQWRQRAVTASTIPGNDGVHFTSVYSLSLADYQHLKEKMLDLIERSRQVVAPSIEEELVCFACDLFRV